MINFGTITKFDLILIAQAVFLFIVILFILLFVFTDKKKAKPNFVVKKRTSIYKNFDSKSILLILLASAGATLLISVLSTSTLTTVITFICIASLLPYSLTSERLRITHENIFDDVIVYCQNMAMLLRQSHNVYSSLNKVKEDLTTTLAEDVKSLIYALDEGKEATKQAMEQIEKNYPYTCIKDLNVILMYMQFENANISDSLLGIFQDDLDILEKDVKDNKARRKLLRFQYIAITVASMFIYWFFLIQIQSIVSKGFDTTQYKVLSTLYILLNLVSLFIVDRRFSSTMTKE